ncbi:glycosyltransferase family 4 protein [uncultured Tateyamaria sp.]|uniref:glycosyltransferase family 4 protein n=1 Tax=uncultured Tateyamaria sp. TaxID=455651 RepID=UPI002603EFEB|nr:glycosyltransferase family 4 protein [uncultured Tateyamaria sp.]
MASKALALPRIAYLTGLYPLVSLTFIEREIAALRDLGAEIHTVSVRETAESQHSGAEGRAAAASTHYLLREAKNPLRLLQAQLRLFKEPARYFTALRTAWRLRNPGLKSMFYQMIYFLEATLMADFVDQKGIGHIHSHFATNGTMVALLTKELTGVPYSFTLHGPVDLFEPEGLKLGAKAENAAFVAVISHFARSQLMLFVDQTHWDRFRIIHCGVDPTLYADAPALPQNADGCRLLFVGRLDPEKGVHVLFEALDDLMPTHTGVTLTMVGDGQDRAKLEVAAARFGDRVRFTGYLDQAGVAQALADHDVLVLPSFSEGLPVILMEALASARPVVTTQVAGVGELVRHRETGLIAPPGDVQTLRRHLETIIVDSALRARMGAAGPSVVAADFDVAQEAAQLANLIAGKLGENPRHTDTDST